jgi:hypothetical protein
MPVIQPQIEGTALSSHISRPKLLTDIRVEHGPIDRLGRFFLEADRAARERGVFLSFSPIDDLVAVNKQNRDTWRPLIPIFDPDEGGFNSENGFCILGCNVSGEVVAAQAARLYVLEDTTFYDASTDLSLFYQNPEAARARGEVCTVTAEATRRITGRFVFSGAGWYRPDYRGRLLTCILPRISRVYAFTRWNTDFTVSMMAEAVIKGGVAERCGYTNVDWDVTIRNFAIGDLRFAFVWMDTSQLLTDLDHFLISFAAQVDRPVETRAGEKQVVP